MQEVISCSQFKKSADGGFNLWCENGSAWGDNSLQNSWQNSETNKLYSTSEAEIGTANTLNSISGSVITSSNLSGEKGSATFPITASSSGNACNAHSKALTGSSDASPQVVATATSRRSGSSMLCGSFSNRDDSQKSSNSQSAQSSITVTGRFGSASGHQSWPSSEQRDFAMWNITDGPQGSTNKPMNQIPHGAKSAHSEPNGLQQASSTQNSNDCHPPHPDMQTNVHKKMDSISRYNNDVASSHGTSGMSGSFLNNNGNSVYRNLGGNGTGAHSNNSQLLSVGANAAESNGSHNQNSSYGAQYNSSAARAKSQVTGCENNSCGNNSSSPYSGWQGLNAAATTSSSNNGWVIPNSLLSSGRNSHDNQNGSTISASNGSSVNDSEENMVVDNEVSYNDLIGATGGSEYTDDKQASSNNYRGNVSWGMPPPRLGLLGGGENSLNSGSSNWSNGQGPTATVGSTAWGGGNRQNSGTTDSSGGGNSDNMMIDNEAAFSGLIGATGGSEFLDAKQTGSNSNYRPESLSRGIPPRVGLLGGGESSLNSAPAGWGGPGPSGAAGTGWVGGGRTSSGTAEMSGSGGTGMSPPKPHNSWAQAAGKGLNPPTQTNNGNNSQSNLAPSADTRSSTSDVSGSGKKVCDEQTSDIKVKAAYSDGWGQSPINQDSPWDYPPSPPAAESNSGKENPPVWRTPVNNGTEIWENTLRLNKGAVTPVATTVAPPWGHTPTTNIGGHWGDDDTSNSMWSGAPQPNTGNSNVNWNEPPPNPPNPNMWGNNNNTNNTPAPPPEKHWSGNQAGPSWNDGGGAPDNGASVWNAPVSKPRNVGNWSPVATPKKENIQQPSGWELPSPPTNRRPPMTNFDDGTAVWGNPQRQGKVSHWKDMPAAKPIINTGGNMPPTGMPPTSMGGGGMPPTGPGMIRLPSGATVGNKGDMGSSVWGKPPMNRNTNWQDMPPHDSSNIGNWGDDNAHMHNAMKNMSGSSNAPGGAFGPQWGEQAMSAYWASKQKDGSNWADGQVDTSSWLGPSKQRGEMMQEGWPATPEDMSGNTWPDGPKDNTIGYWNGEGPNPTMSISGGWAGRKLKGGKPVSRDMIWASKQFRLLIEMGFKKEEAENSLRNNSMNFDESLVELRATTSLDGNMMDVDSFHGRKMRPANMPEDISMPDHGLDQPFGTGNFHAPGGFQGVGNFQGVSNVPAFKPQIKCSGPNNTNATSLLHAALGGQQSSIGSISNLPPAIFNKLMHQQQQQQQQQQQPQAPIQPFAPNIQQLNNQANRAGQSNFPSAAQLRHLVQQIQMAVHAGHLNPQILNQPLAPQTLQLLYQLLQQIKVLHQLQQHQLIQGQHLPKPLSGGGPNSSGLQISVQITQTKQRILNLQNQIAAQQAVFLKQQVPQPQQPLPPQHQPLHVSQTSDIYKPNIEPMPSLHSEFRDLSIKDVPLQAHQSQSRLNQWKLPSYEKEEHPLCSMGGGPNISGGINAGSAFNNDFSRAPGPLPSKSSSSSASSSMPNPGPNVHPLLSQGDSAWSSLSRSQSDSGWPETATSLSGMNDNVSNSVGNGSNNVSVSSAVPNMGNSNGQSSLDSKEPSTTPPSSGPSTSSASHSSYNLTDLVPEFEPGKPWKGTQMKSIEDDPHITPGSITRSPLSVNTIKDTDLFWNSKSSPATTGSDSGTLTSSTWIFTPSSAVNNSSTGLISKPVNSKSNWSSLTNDVGSSGSDLWGSSVSKSRGPPPGLSGQGWDRQNSSTFLLLRNLTPQIDGSTLKTLCMQHGPLHLFHLSLNHGIALVRYSSREEASKAQSALNNCVLGNTTILADIPNESEVQQYLVLLSNQNATGNMGWPTSQQQSGSNAPGFRSNSTSYPFSSSAGSSTNNNSGKQDSAGWNGSNLNMPSQLWSYPNTSSTLWGSSQPINDHDSSTNSSLNRFLPDDLLGGESM